MYKQWAGLRIVYPRAVSFGGVFELGALHEVIDAPDGRGDVAVDGLELAAHDDGFAGTGLDTHAAEDTAEHVDLVTDGILLDGRIFMFGGHNGDAVGRAGRGAHHAGRAARTAVGPLGEDVYSPKPVGVLPGDDSRIRKASGRADLKRVWR